MGQLNGGEGVQGVYKKPEAGYPWRMGGPGTADGMLLQERGETPCLTVAPRSEACTASCGPPFSPDTATLHPILSPFISAIRASEPGRSGEG